MDIEVDCPFCKKNSELCLSSSGIACHYIECNRCGCSGPVGSNPDRAIEWWNKAKNIKPKEE